jgi:hypothetical protein
MPLRHDVGAAIVAYIRHVDQPLATRQEDNVTISIAQKYRNECMKRWITNSDQARKAVEIGRLPRTYHDGSTFALAMRCSASPSGKQYRTRVNHGCNLFQLPRARSLSDRSSTGATCSVEP